jgi:hypothetical protein
VFTASPDAACTDGGKEKTFQLDGNKVYWAHTTDTGLGRVAAAGRRIR